MIQEKVGQGLSPLEERGKPRGDFLCPSGTGLHVGLLVHGAE